MNLRIMLLMLALLLSGAVAAPQIAPLPSPLSLLERYQPQPVTPQSRAQAGQTWTVLVYIAVDNNIWPSALEDLREMQQVGSSDGVRFVVQIDAPPPGNKNTRGFDSFDGGLRVLMTRAVTDDFSRAALNAVVPKLNVVERIPEPNSADPKVLAEFINWGVRRYPAQHYGVVLWDHGGAWRLGYGEDDTSRAIMSTWQVRQALLAGMAQSGLQRFDFLSFDACLMGGAELLYEYGDLMDVFIANPETDYGPGWDYTGAFNALKGNPAISTKEFARREIKYYEAQHLNSSNEDDEYHAHVAYDLTQLENFTAAINAFVGAATRSTDRRALLAARSKTVSYGFEASEPNVVPQYADIGQYALLVASTTRDPNLAQAGRQLAAAVEQLAFAKTLGTKVTDALGLAVWFPNDPSNAPSSAEIGAYSSRLRMAGSANWKAFLDVWLNKIVPGVQDANQAVEVSVTRKVNLRDPSVRNPSVIGFEVTGSADLIYGELGEAVGRNGFNVYGNLYLQNGGPGQYEYPWDGQWFDVTGASGSSDFFTGFYRQAGNSSIFANAEYLPPGRTQGFSVIVTGDLNSARLNSVMDNSSVAPRDITLRAGGTLRFQFLQRDLLTGDTTLNSTGRSVTIPDGGIQAMRLERKRMPLGEYYLIFGARDVAGNTRSGNAPVQIR